METGAWPETTIRAKTSIMTNLIHHIFHEENLRALILQLSWVLLSGGMISILGINLGAFIERSVVLALRH